MPETKTDYYQDLQKNLLAFLRANGITECVIVMETGDQKTVILQCEVAGEFSPAYSLIKDAIEQMLIEANKGLQIAEWRCINCSASDITEKLSIGEETDNRIVARCPICNSDKIEYL